jgi:hypothetical protein
LAFPEDFTSENPAVDDPYFGLPSADDAQVWGLTTLLTKSNMMYN